MDIIFCEAGPSFKEVVVEGLCTRVNSWSEHGSMQEIQEFGLVFLHTHGVCHVRIRWMGSRQGSTIISQVDRPKSVVSISCADDGCGPIDDEANIFFIR